MLGASQPEQRRAPRLNAQRPADLPKAPGNRLVVDAVSAHLDATRPPRRRAGRRQGASAATTDREDRQARLTGVSAPSRGMGHDLTNFGFVFIHARRVQPEQRRAPRLNAQRPADLPKAAGNRLVVNAIEVSVQPSLVRVHALPRPPHEGYH